MPSEFTISTRSNEITSNSINTHVPFGTASTASRRKHKTTSNRPSQQRSQWAGHVDSPSNREIHSSRMSPVLEEMEPKLRSIREAMNKSQIEHTDPKVKSEAPRRVPLKPMCSINNIDLVGLCGKAGRSIYIVNVGAAGNLYTTSKHTGNRSWSIITIDLHGHTKQQALTALDTSLPCWVDTAMKQEHPYIIQVKIVCGKGSQILSEVVENWIRNKDKVANAPKNKHLNISKR